MNAVAGAAMPVSSSLDPPARISSNVALCLSLHSSPSRNSSKNLSLSVCRYTSRRGRGIAEAKASSFSIDSDDEEEELVYGNAGAQVSQFAGRRNVTRQGASASKAGVSGASHLWKTQKQHTTGVSSFEIHQARVSLSSEFAHTSQNRDRDDAMAHLKGRDLLPFEEQQQRASFVDNQHRRVPLPTKNRHLRMHNKVSPFKSVRQPSISQLSLDNHADASSWGVVDEDVAPSNFNGPAPNSYQDLRRRPKNSQFSSHGIKENVQKGTKFMSKMEEVLLSLKKKDDLLRNNPAMNQKALRDESTFTHAGQGFRTATSKGKKAEESGSEKSLKSSENQSEKSIGSEIESSARYANITSARDGNRGLSLMDDGKGLQKDLGQATSLLKENARMDTEAGVTSFNLFSSSPSVPWEADRTYAASTFKPCIPVRRGILRPLALRSFRSAGSRSSPSRPSVNSRNVNHLKLDSRAANSVVDLSKCIGGDEQTEARFEVREGNVLNDEKSRAQNASLKGAAKAEAQAESVNFEWTQSIAEENGDKAFSNHQSTGKSLIEAHAPSNSSLSVLSLHDDSDNEVNEESNVYTESNVEVVVPPGIDSLERSHHNRKSVPSGDLDVDAASPLEFNSSERYLHSMKEILPSSMTHTNVASAQYPGEMTLGASEMSNGSNHPNSASWHKHDFPGLPFEFQFSYSETPKAPVLGYREIPYSPFGPSTMGRPWTGGPHPVPSKKKKRVFDSFKPPPKDKKGVKHVEDPGPYPEGQGPKPAKSREEILGEPLTKEEIVYLVEKCERGSRQLNLGRDGLTHNMLDLIHCHWKRRRVCKIKCKGVPTLDMDNVKFHIEDKTGGKILYQAGGVLYLFRGRNYNYKDRPQIPLMHWKPMTPYYPKLIQPAPEGLTKEEAHRLRVLGRKVQPICRLGKNGVYLNLVKDVRAAFKVDELVRIDCQGLHPRDYKKIGAKLKDLVPCVLLSFDKECILMWKGKEDLSVESRSLSRSPDSGPHHATEEILKQSSSITEEGSARSICEEEVDISADEASSSAHSSAGEPNNSEQESGSTLDDASQEFSTYSSDAGASSVLQNAKEHVESEKANIDETLSSSNTKDEGQALTDAEENKCASNSQVLEEENVEMSAENINGLLKNISLMGDGVYVPSIDSSFKRHATADRKLQQKTESEGLGTTFKEMSYSLNLELEEDVDEELVQSEAASSNYVFVHEEGGLVSDQEVDMCLDNQSNDAVHLDALWDHAFQSGMAVVLPNEGMDADLIVREAAQLAELAPLGPTYTMKLMYKLRLKKNEDRPADILQIRFGRGRPQKIPKKVVKRKFQLPTLDVPGMGGLPVDELAMLLAPKQTP